MYFEQPASPSVLAFVSIIHLALVALRAHRSSAGAFSLLTLVSLLFSGSPWLMPGVAGMALGLVAHAAWFAACERLAPVMAPTPAARASKASTPPASTPSVRRPPGVTALARRPPQFVQTPVMAVFNETADTRTYRMARPEGFDFKAGQFLTLRVRADGRDHVRCYSISSSPDARGHLEITVKRHGLVSGTLHATVRPGSLLSVRAPAGAFVYPGGDERPLVLIAGGVGITPLMSMLRHALDSEPTRPVVLLYSVRTAADIVFGEEIAWLNRRHAQFRAVVAVTACPAAEGQFPGRINEALVSATVPDLGHSVCQLCGPSQMIADVTAVLVSLGVPRSQIHNEVFEAAVAAAGGPSSPAPAATPTVGRAYEMQFARSGVSTTVAPEQTLLEASEACGADIPSLCRAGVCGTCRTRVLKGDVDCTSQILDEDDRQEGFVLPCVSRARSDCHVDA
jgi:ferredoxin-NADP reductase